MYKNDEANIPEIFGIIFGQPVKDTKTKYSRMNIFIVTT